MRVGRFARCVAVFIVAPLLGSFATAVAPVQTINTHPHVSDAHHDASHSVPEHEHTGIDQQADFEGVFTVVAAATILTARLFCMPSRAAWNTRPPEQPFLEVLPPIPIELPLFA